MDKKRILVIEDEAELVKAVEIRLKSANYEVLVAYDGQEGLEKVKKENPDLIILDLMLPKVDGFKVCRALKFDDKYKHIPIILFTARAQENDKKLGKDVKADAYITKPFDHEALLDKIKELIQK